MLAFVVSAAVFSKEGAYLALRPPIFVIHPLKLERTTASSIRSKDEGCSLNVASC